MLTLKQLEEKDLWVDILEELDTKKSSLAELHQAVKRANKKLEKTYGYKGALDHIDRCCCRGTEFPKLANVSFYFAKQHLEFELKIAHQR